MNIASRVETYCRILDTPVLVTGEFVEALLAEGSLDLAKAFVDEGVHALRGCKEPVRLFSMKREPRSALQPLDRLVCGRPADEVG